MRNRRSLCRRALALLLAFLFLFWCSACGKGNPSRGQAGKSIVCVSFPEYDWVRSILGDNPGGWEAVLLLDKGVDLHSFQPDVQDILKVTSCDVLIHTGGPSSGWITEALKEADRWEGTEISLLAVLGDAVRTEEQTEGMEGEEEEEAEPDEHVWLSLRNAEVLVSEISGVLQQKDPSHAETYRANAQAYLEKLAALDAAYQKTSGEAAVHTILVADRFPFRYLTDDYEISYYAAFPGCSAETEASFKTVAFLSEKVQELSLPAILKIEGSDGRIAEIVSESAGNPELKILTLDSMQSVTAEKIRDGETYLGIMEKNLETLKEAMNP